MWGDTIDVSDKEMKVVLTKLIIFLDQTSSLRKAKHLFWQDVISQDFQDLCGRTWGLFPLPCW